MDRSSQQGRQPASGGYNDDVAAQPIDNMADVAVRGAALLWDLQLDVARNLWRTQSRAAAMLGIPDYSALFRVNDERARRVFAAGTEQMLDAARQARETVVQVQRQLGRLAEQQTIAIAEEMRQQIQALGQQTQRGLQEIREVAGEQADEVEQATQRLAEIARPRAGQHELSESVQQTPRTEREVAGAVDAGASSAAAGRERQNGDDRSRTARRAGTS